MTEPLLQLAGLSRVFLTGDEQIAALDGIDLQIEAGEMVAVVGASGSGKSTLMHILGCLDRATVGSYRVAGRETAGLTPDELAELRREHFGFIFQRYHLLGDTNAIGNVEMPAVYAGGRRAARRERARALLARLGLDDRLTHRPGQLSGGQQQRVAIARALMNGGDIILADEPTGALDRHSGRQVIDILRELHQEGHTIILVTHDLSVAEHADRIIEIRDGRIVADRRIAAHAHAASTSLCRQDARARAPRRRWTRLAEQIGETLLMALRAMSAHPLRTFLTMLGIIIGIAAVVAVVALGEGAQRRVLAQINELGANTVSIFPGTGFGDERADRITTLVAADAEALAAQPYVDSVTPEVSTSGRVRLRDLTAQASINGVGEGYFRVNGLAMARGRTFDRESVRQRAPDVVIDENARRTLFADAGDPLGQILLVQQVPCRVIGVIAPRPGGDRSVQLYLPYTTVLGRITGPVSLNGLTVRVVEAAATTVAEQAIVRMLTLRHGTKDFFVYNSDRIRRTVEKTAHTLKLLIAGVAFISLLVGGIGVMNIMLVSVTERTHEIGLRIAVGARRRDILLQFLIEAVLICLGGAAVGVALALIARATLGRASGDFPMIVSTTAIVAACATATVIGVVFGFAPAQRAARLEPVDALSRE